MLVIIGVSFQVRLNDVSNPCLFFVQGRKILSEFSDIMEESHNSIKITDKTEWWQSRWKLDDRLRVGLV